MVSDGTIPSTDVAAVIDELKRRYFHVAEIYTRLGKATAAMEAMLFDDLTRAVAAGERHGVSRTYAEFESLLAEAKAADPKGLVRHIVSRMELRLDDICKSRVVVNDRSYRAILRGPTPLARDDSETAGLYLVLVLRRILNTVPDAPLRAIHASLRVFLCHAKEDKKRVRDLYQLLKSAGFQPWLDEEDLHPGHEWQHEIRRAIERSDVVLVCLSRRSTSKAGYVQREIVFALDVAEEQPEGGIYLIPVKLEECEVPFRLRRWQWISLFESDAEERLLRTFQCKLIVVCPMIRLCRAAGRLSGGTRAMSLKDGLSFMESVPPRIM